MFRNRIALVFLCACLTGGAVFAQQQAPKQKYVAIFLDNTNVAGKSFPKGLQLPIQSLDGHFNTAVVEFEDTTYDIPKNLIRIIAAEKAGVSIIRADYGVPGQASQNVTSTLQKLVLGQSKVSMVVSDAIWNSRRQGGGNRVDATTGETRARVLMVVYSYRGETRTAMAAEGQTLVLP